MSLLNRNKNKKKPRPSPPFAGRYEAELYDPDREYPVIRASICTGEKVAGFRNKASGQFTEVMLIRSPKDLEAFKARYRIDTVKTEY